MVLYGIAPYQIWITEADQCIAILFFIVWPKFKSCVTKISMVETQYCESQFLESFDADNLSQSIKDSASGLNEVSFYQLAMDGPNVNWLVLNNVWWYAYCKWTWKKCKYWKLCSIHNSWWLPNWNFKRWLEQWRDPKSINLYEAILYPLMSVYGI